MGVQSSREITSARKLLFHARSKGKIRIPVMNFITCSLNLKGAILANCVA